MADLALLAEELDFDSVWAVDRVIVPESNDRAELSYPFGMMDGPPQQIPVNSRGGFYQGPPLIPWLAAKTSKIRIGMSVFNLPYRAPAIMAADCATIDQLSGGRLNVGIGSGWMVEEFAAVGAGGRVPPSAQAGARNPRHHDRRLDERPVRVPRRVRRLRPVRLRRQARAAAAPADLVQRVEEPGDLRQADRQVQPARVDRHPGHPRGIAASGGPPSPRSWRRSAGPSTTSRSPA